MKLLPLFSAVVLGVLTWQAGSAQIPAGTPSGSTGQCKDGSYTNAPNKRGACKGHLGVKAWFATPPAKTYPATATADIALGVSTDPDRNVSAIELAAASPIPQAKATTTASTKTAAPGGGRGLVWLNTSNNVYHCYGTPYYGTTKAGKYVSEADAKAAGAHPDQGNACSH
jgi:hypothetical protein